MTLNPIPAHKGTLKSNWIVQQQPIRNEVVTNTSKVVAKWESQSGHETGQETSEVIQLVLETAQGNLCKIGSQRLNKSLTLTLISEYKEFLRTQSFKMKQKCEKSTSR